MSVEIEVTPAELERRLYRMIRANKRAHADRARSSGILEPPGSGQVRIRQWFYAWCASQRRPSIEIRERHYFTAAALSIDLAPLGTVAPNVVQKLVAMLRAELDPNAYYARVVVTPSAMTITATAILKARAQDLAQAALATLAVPAPSART